jgi:hypothetical protein
MKLVWMIGYVSIGGVVVMCDKVWKTSCFKVEFVSYTEYMLYKRA